MDGVRWKGSSDGTFSVRSLRKFIDKNHGEDPIWKDIVWRGFAPPKVEIFIWQVLRNRVPVQSELTNRGNSKSGIGGLLRDDSGMILMEFSEASSLSLPALVELEAINFGISYLLTTSWSLTHRLIVESDCKMVVDWINGMIEHPITVANKVIETAKLMFAKGMCLTLIPRCCNVLADTLAKQGIG
ncbi:hypothetical protein GQ457_10G009830 [Hibiscus cannabinus]